MNRNNPSRRHRKSLSKANGPRPTQRKTLPALPLNDQVLKDLDEHLRAVSTRISAGEALLKLGVDGIPRLSGSELEEVTRVCIEVENELLNEGKSTCERVIELYCLAMAHLGVHAATLDAEFRESLSLIQPEYLEYQPQVLSPESLEQMKSLAMITAQFLKSRAGGLCDCGFR